MAVSSVRVQLNGTWHNLTKNSSTGLWEAQVTAPPTTSYHLTGGYYPLTLEASSSAGTKVTANSSDPSIGQSLRLVVKERIKPTVTIKNPGAGAYASNNRYPISFQILDETGGSGIKLDTLRLTLDGTVYQSAGMNVTEISGGYDVTFTPPVLADGRHTVSITVSDNDGNTSEQATVSYTIDTVPPTLNVTAPLDGLITADRSLTIVGVTNDATSSTVSVKILLNGADQGSVSVSADGTFRKAVQLQEGENTLKITSTDLAGKSTTVTLSTVLDTTEPIIGAVSIVPNPVDAGATLLISVEVS